MNAVLKEEPADYSILEVPVNDLDNIWDEHIKDIMKLPVDRSHGEVTLETTKERIKQGIAKLFIIVEDGKVIALNTLELRTFDSGEKALYNTLVGGTKMDMWGMDFLSLMIKMGNALGCRELRGIAVRDGWMRKLKKLGWTEVHTIISMKLED